MIQSIATTQQAQAVQPKVQLGQDSLLQPLSSTKSIAKINSVKDKEEIEKEQEEEERETYGLSVLEQMSDDEYAAFKRITTHMTYGEKLMAAQALYRFTSFQDKEGANYPREMKNGYGNTLNFVGKYAKAVMWGDMSLDERS